MLLATAYGRIIYIDFPYRGKVIDKESKQPIGGAAVVAVWWMETFTFVQAMISFYEAHESVTDQEGNFTAPWVWGASINPLKKVRRPLFTVFKPGYEAYSERHLERPLGWSRTVVELRRLSSQKERLENLTAAYLGPLVPEKKYPMLNRLKSVERVNLGLTE